MRAIVAGGGPAGLSAALGLLRLGGEVSLYEQRQEWAPRVCGSFLNAEAVRHLKWLGVWNKIQEAGAVPVPLTRLATSRGVRCVVGTRQKKFTAATLPRQELEEILLAAARSEGVAIHMGTRVIEQSCHDHKWHVVARDVAGHLHNDKSDLFIAADGRFSMSEPRQKKPASGWYGWNAAFSRVRQQPGEMSLHLAGGRYVGVATFANGESNVCGLIQMEAGRSRKWEEVFEDTARQIPDFKQATFTARRIGDWRGVGPLPFSMRMRSMGDILPVGDAAAVADPFMGEGIGRALGAGPLLTAAAKQSRFMDTGNREEFLKSYRYLWRQTYQTRLILGRALRTILGNQTLFSTFDRLLLHSWVLNSMTPMFHLGYEPH